MDTATTATQSGQNIWSWVILVVMFAALYFLMIRPQKKKEKETAKMRTALKPGDKIITIGGICGTIARVKEDSDRVIIMTGTDRSKMEILKNAIAQIDGAEESATVKAEKIEEEVSAKPNKKNIKKLGAKEETEEAPAKDAE